MLDLAPSVGDTLVERDGVQRQLANIRGHDRGYVQAHNGECSASGDGLDITTEQIACTRSPSA